MRSPSNTISRGSILIIEDDDTLVASLTRENFDVRKAADEREALQLTTERAPDLVLVDSTLQSKPGAEVCRHLRRMPPTTGLPIIMLINRKENQLHGLQTGADEYITKPIAIHELIRKIQDRLNRNSAPYSQEKLIYNDFFMDTITYRVRRAGKPIVLAPAEFRLLRHFLMYPGQVFSREKLMSIVAPRHDAIALRTVDTHIRRLRHAINDKGTLPDIIRTVWLDGYALDKPSKGSAS